MLPTTVLLVFVLLLLVAIVVMLVTGWPGRLRAELERTTSALRREMAEHRGDSMRLMQAIRAEVEDAVQETLDREMASYGRNRRGASFPPQDQGVTSQASGQTHGAGVGSGAASASVSAAAAAGTAWVTSGPVEESRQLSLFTPSPAEDETPLVPEPPAVPDAAPPDPQENREGMTKVDAVLHDDSPDIDDIPDLDDLD